MTAAASVAARMTAMPHLGPARRLLAPVSGHEVRAAPVAVGLLGAAGGLGIVLGQALPAPLAPRARHLVRCPAEVRDHPSGPAAGRAGHGGRWVGVAG